MDKKRLTKLISFFSMGDGGLYIQKKNAYFVMNMLKKNEDYILWVKSVLEEVTGVHLYDRKDYNTDGCTRQPQLRLHSNTHPFFTTIRDRIYLPDGHKGIDMHTMKLLDWEAMAILFMCDGSTCVDFRPSIGMKNPSVNVTLNMKRLSEAEQVVLKKTIRDNLGVEFNVQKQNKYFYLRLRVRDVNKFMDGIEPFMCESFKYKIIRTNSSEKSDDEIV